jgi:hypothetical protein
MYNILSYCARTKGVFLLVGPTFNLLNNVCVIFQILIIEAALENTITYNKNLQ